MATYYVVASYIRKVQSRKANSEASMCESSELSRAPLFQGIVGSGGEAAASKDVVKGGYSIAFSGFRPGVFY